MKRNFFLKESNTDNNFPFQLLNSSARNTPSPSTTTTTTTTTNGLLTLSIDFSKICQTWICVPQRNYSLQYKTGEKYLVFSICKDRSIYINMEVSYNLLNPWISIPNISLHEISQGNRCSLVVLISPRNMWQIILSLLAHWLSGRVFTNGPGDRGSISGQVIPKTQKVVLDTSLLNTQQHKVCIKDKVEQYRERSSTLVYTSV